MKVVYALSVNQVSAIVYKKVQVVRENKLEDLSYGILKYDKIFVMYSKILKATQKEHQNWFSLMKVKSIAECS